MRLARAGAPGSGVIASKARARARHPRSDVPDYDPLTISDEELKQLPPAERGAVYKVRAQARAAGGGPAPAPAAGAAPASAPAAAAAGTPPAAPPRTPPAGAAAGCPPPRARSPPGAA